MLCDQVIVLMMCGRHQIWHVFGGLLRTQETFQMERHRLRLEVTARKHSLPCYFLFFFGHSYKSWNINKRFLKSVVFP